MRLKFNASRFFSFGNKPAKPTVDPQPLSRGIVEDKNDSSGKDKDQQEGQMADKNGQVKNIIIAD